MTEEYYSTTLPNGLRLLTQPMPSTRSVAVSIYVGAGSRYERPQEAGLSHLVEHLLFKGTKRRPTSRHISEIIDGVGGVLNAGTDKELTVYYGKVARPHLELVVDVLLDMLRHSLFEEEELEKERRVILEELASIADSPPQLVDVLIDSVLWPGQPLGRDIAGSRESVSALNREMVLDYVGRQYVPNNIVISFAGSVTHEEALALIEQHTGDWPRGATTGWFPAVGRQERAQVGLIYKRTEQAHISLAFRGLPIEHPERHTLDLLSAILGEGMSSRLFLELREHLGLCYDVHCYPSHFLDTGALDVYAGVEPGNAVKTLTALMAELRRVREDVGEEELTRAKEMSKGRILLRMEDTRAVSGWNGAQELLLGRVWSVDEVLEKVEAVKLDDLLRLANRLLVDKALNLAIVGPFRSERRFLPLLTL